jgi:hypothetical protein
MKHLLSKKPKTVAVPFMETETVEVRKLSTAQVLEFQSKLKAANEASEADAGAGIAIQRDLIRMAVVGAEELTDAEMDSFPLDDISKLSTTVLELAGIKAPAEGNA